MANTITGRIKAIGQTQALQSKRTGNTFLKREMLLDMTRHDPWTGERDTHENIVLLEFGGERSVALLDTVQAGQVVTVSFSVRGFSYEKDGQTRYMTKIEPYRIEPVQQMQQMQPAQQQSAPSGQWQQPAAQLSQSPFNPAGTPEQLPF